MKVEQVEPKPTFKPIQITLETPEEAKLIWCCLNFASVTIRECKSCHSKLFSALVNINYFSIWEEFNKIFRPEEEC